MKANPTTSWKVADGLFLVCHTLASDIAAPPPKPEPTNHVLVIDCSGSMSWDLPMLRASVKAKVPSLIGEDDTITIVWFSGRGEFGVLPGVEGVRLANMKDLTDVHRAIDRWLKPVGLTAFVEPLREVAVVLDRVDRKNPGRAALFFLSDGMDNCWRKEDIYAAIAAIAPRLASATFIEFGPYADRPTLTRMAEKAGGSVIYAADFAAYEPVFVAAMGKKTPAAKKTQVVLGTMPVGGFAFALDGDEVLTFGADEIGGAPGRLVVGAGVSVPGHLTKVWHLSTEAAGETKPLATVASVGADAEQAPGRVVPVFDLGVLPAAYATMAVFAQRVQPKVVWSFLRALGDVSFIDEFGLCFGKQRYSAFIDRCKAAATTGTGWYEKGYDPKRVPRDDATTILDVMDLLASDERCRILTESAAFTYTRIGRKAESKADMLTVTESEQVAELAKEMGEKAGEREVAALRDVLAKLGAILNGRKKPLKFVLDPTWKEGGYAIGDLVWKEGMPNLSFRVKQYGTVDISAEEDVPKNVRDALPQIVSTYRYRTYTVVKDGFVHVEWLPVRVPKAVYETLLALDVVDPTVDVVKEVSDGIYELVLDLRRTPVINQNMVNSASARALAEKTWKLLELKAAAKVWKHYTPERKSAGFATVYGKEAAAWLDANGITDHSGFRVESTSAPSRDFFMAKQLDVTVPGFSSLPSVEDVRSRMEPDPKAKKPKALTPAAKLMVPHLAEVDAFRASPFFAKAADKESLFEKWVGDQAKQAVKETRRLQTEIAKQKFSILIGQIWFKEFSSMDENKLKVDLGGESREVTFELDMEVKVSL